jgi:hypothetical protein
MLAFPPTLIKLQLLLVFGRKRKSHYFIGNHFFNYLVGMEQDGGRLIYPVHFLFFFINRNVQLQANIALPILAFIIGENIPATVFIFIAAKLKPLR